MVYEVTWWIARHSSLIHHHRPKRNVMRLTGQSAHDVAVQATGRSMFPGVVEGPTQFSFEVDQPSGYPRISGRVWVKKLS